MPRLRFLFLALALTALPLAAFEIPVGPPVYGEAFGLQHEASVASDGDGYFAVWLDQRSGTGGVDLVGTRLSGSGEVLDGLGIIVARGVHSSERPRVVWSGSAYLVLWTQNGSPGGLRAVRIDREGRVLDFRTMAVNGFTGSSPFAASNGSRVVVVYSRLAGAFLEMRAVILDPDGNVLDDIALADTGYGRFSPTITTNGSEFVAAWAGVRDPNVSPPMLEAVRLSASGERIDDTPFGIGRGERVLLASDGHDYVVLSERAGQWYSHAVSADLLQVSTSHPIGGPFSSLVPLWTGSRYTVFGARFFNNGLDVVRFTIDREGRPSAVVVEEPIRLLTGGVTRLDAATNGSTLLRAWTEGPDSNAIGVVGRVSSAGAGTTAIDGPPRILTASANGQNDARIAHGGGVDLVAWREESGIYAARITSDGHSLDGRGVHLGRSRFWAPAVAFDGAQFVVAWPDFASGVTFVRFLSPAGGLLPDELRIPSSFNAPTLAAGGEGSLITWAGGPSVVAAMIDRDSRTLAGPPVTVWKGETIEFYAAGAKAAWNGSAFLIAWTEYQDGSFGTHPGIALFKRIRGARLNASLTLLDTAPLVLGDGEGDGDRNPAVASDGQDWLLVWQAGEQLRARRIGASGTGEGAEAGVLLAPGFAPDVAWNGNRYVAAWKIPPQFLADQPRNVRFGSIARSGSIVLLDPRTITQTFAADPVSVTATTGGRYAIAYVRVAYEAIYGGVPRAFVQRLGVTSRRRAVR